MKVFFVDKSISVLINHVEGLFEFLNLGLVKHGKNIGSRALGPLFGGHPAACCLSGRHVRCKIRERQINGNEKCMTK